MAIYIFILIYIISGITLVSSSTNSPQERKYDPLFSPKNIITVSLPVEGNSPDEPFQMFNLSIGEDRLRKRGLTKELLQTGKVLKRKIDDGYVILMKGNRTLDVSIETRQMTTFVDKKGEFKFNMDKQLFNKRTMDDIKDDPELIPGPPLNLTWEPADIKPLESITLEVYPKNQTVFLNGQQAFSSNISQKEEGNFVKGSGLLVLSVNLLTSKITFSNILSTNDFGEYRDLIWSIDTIRPNNIIIISTLYEASLNFPVSARKHLEELGSTWSHNYLSKDIWSWIFIKDGPTLAEVLTPAPKKAILKRLNGKPHRIHVSLNKIYDTIKNKVSIPGSMDCPNWPKSKHWEHRRIFCQINEGYGRLCHCTNPLQFEKKRFHNHNNETDFVFIIPAGTRSRYLTRLLESLSIQRNLYADQMLIVLDGNDENVEKIANILGIQVINHRPLGTKETRVSTNLRFGIFNTLHIFPKANYFMVIEDDLILSPDFYSYMRQLSPIFQMDPSVFCISGFNHLSYPHTSRDIHKIYRVHSYPAYGWMMNRNILEDILPKWLPSYVDHTWDYFLGSEVVRKGREILVPDIARSYHGGVSGVHMKVYNAETSYLMRTINQDPDAKVINISRLIKDVYEEEYVNDLKMAMVVEVLDPYNIKFPPNNDGTYIIYAEYKSEMDTTAFQMIGNGLGIWDKDARDAHHYSWRFNHYNKTTFVVGIPMSKYTSLARPTDPVFSATDEMKEYLENHNYLELNSLTPMKHNPPNDYIPVGEIQVLI